MTREKLKSVIELTKECLEKYWQNDYNFVVDYLCEDATWIGANQSQFMQGKNEIKNDFEKISKELKKCHLLNQEFYVADNSGNCCTVVGRYLVTTDKNQNVFLQTQQRCTFVWKIIDNKFKIKLINVSNPIGEMKLTDKESFPNNIGKIVMKHFNSELDKYKQNTKKLTFYDIKNRLRVINVDDIEYAESAKRNVIIYTNEESIIIKNKWKDFLSSVENILVQVHRSYAININNLSIIDEREIILKNGVTIPIPYKKRNEIKEMIKKLYQTE